MGFFANRKKKKQEEAERQRRLATYAEGKYAYKKGDYATAIEKFRQCVEYGDAEANFCLAQEYESGQHVAKDLDQAVTLYEKCMGTDYECASRVALYRILTLPGYAGRSESRAMEHLETAVAYERRNRIFVYGAHYEQALIHGKKGQKALAADDLEAAFPISKQWNFYKPGIQRLKEDIRTYNLPITLGVLAYMTTEGDERASELFIPLFLEDSRCAGDIFMLYEQYAGVYTNPYLHYLLAQKCRQRISNCASEVHRETYYEYLTYHCLALQDNLMVSYSRMRELKPGLREAAQEIRRDTYTGREYLSVLNGPAPRPKFQ